MTYEDYRNINQANKEYNDKASQYLADYANKVKENTGEEAYFNSLKRGQAAATSSAANASNAATAQAQAAQQQSGMSKAASAMNAANQAASNYGQTYANTLANQQGIYQQFAQNAVVGYGNVYSNQLQQAQVQYQQKLAEYEHKMAIRNQMMNTLMSFATSASGALIKGATALGTKGNKSSAGSGWTTDTNNTFNNIFNKNNLGVGVGVSNPTFVSDENEKDITPDKAEKFLKDLETFAYSYKNPEENGEKEGEVDVGFSAQSAPDELVVEKDGHLEVDRKRLQEAIFAGLAELKKEIDSDNGEQ